MNMISKSLIDNTSIYSSNVEFLFIFWQKILNKPTANVSGSLIYGWPLLSAGVLVVDDWKHLCSLTSAYLALIQSQSK